MTEYTRKTEPPKDLVTFTVHWINEPVCLPKMKNAPHRVIMGVLRSDFAPFHEWMEEFDSNLNRLLMDCADSEFIDLINTWAGASADEAPKVPESVFSSLIDSINGLLEKNPDDKSTS